MDCSGIWENLRSEASRVGYGRALQRSLYSVTNKHLQMRFIEIICLTRQRLSPLDPVAARAQTSRLATEGELLAMQKAGTWQLSAEHLGEFRNGDSCLLSFVDGRLSGYTWVHSGGRPEILPGLRIRIPEGYLYNYAGYTAPGFRGLRLQSFRHSAVLNLPCWTSKKGMFGYVECTNWSSKKGQSKSGYTKIGELTLLGHNNHFATHFSGDLKSRGIRRLHA